jgi:hypothetical protein
MQSSMPETFRSILWSYDFDQLDPEKHRKTLIVQTINYGSLMQWRWLREHYGRDVVRQVLHAVPASELRPPAQRLAGLVFGVDHFNHAPRGTH